MLFCVDLNTMALVWAQDTKDDNNATPVFEWGDDGNGYLYCATSMEYCDGRVYMYKINAANGEIVWETEFDNVYFNYSVSGGILSSPVLGKKGTDLEGMIIYSIARTPNSGSGLLVALDTDTGEIIWQQSLTYYCWSSPVAVYSESGKVYLVLCDSVGYVMLIDALTGTTITSIGIGANVEASPAVFNDMLVVGTRGMQVHGIRLS
jgi:outer membrane protein assembly factor BamB